MLFDNVSREMCLSGKVICAFFVPLIEVNLKIRGSDLVKHQLTIDGLKQIHGNERASLDAKISIIHGLILQTFTEARGDFVNLR
jgi:hypothetical protein